MNNDSAANATLGTSRFDTVIFLPNKDGGALRVFLNQTRRSPLGSQLVKRQH